MTDVYKLVPIADLTAYVKAPAGDLALLTTIRDALEELLERETNQIFGAEGTADIVEKRDGTGTKTIWTNRPIKSLTSITLTIGPVDATTILPITDTMQFTVGKRRLKSWQYILPDLPNSVVITYTPAANQPALAVQAVKELSAAVYRRIGSEDARSEQLGTFSHVLLRTVNESLIWQRAVELLAIFPTY